MRNVFAPELPLPCPEACLCLVSGREWGDGRQLKFPTSIGHPKTGNNRRLGSIEFLLIFDSVPAFFSVSKDPNSLIEPVEHVTPQLGHVNLTGRSAPQIIKHNSLGKNMIGKTPLSGDLLVEPGMETVFEPGAPIIEGPGMFVERTVAQRADRFFERIPFVKLKLVGIALHLGTETLAGLLTIRLDIPFSHRTENTFDNERLPAHDLQRINHVLPVLERDKAPFFGLDLDIRSVKLFHGDRVLILEDPFEPRIHAVHDQINFGPAQAKSATAFFKALFQDRKRLPDERTLDLGEIT